ncbi:MAG: glutamate--tRNA ligase [Halobacteriaceae archaeon]
MDEQLRNRIQTAAEVSALVNAIKHESDAKVDAVIGPLMGDHPEFREYGDEIPEIIAPVVDKVNSLSQQEKRQRLEELAPDKLEEIESETEEESTPLPELPNADDYDEIRMRLAPNPNGPYHIGHARMPSVIGTYKEMYDGWFCCRFDDTDPETKRPNLDAYDDILSDIAYLGFEPDEVYRASDRLDIYYEHARNLIKQGGAYTCSCAGEEFSELKRVGEPCPHRDKETSQTLAEFEDMIAGEYNAGDMVLRVKTEITHDNPAVRDWVAFRMVDTPHPRPAAKGYSCWPMLDFQSGIDDHLTGVTHIIRGIDLQDSARRQQFVYDYFDWDYPEVLHWGHVQVDAYDVKMSTSRIRELIEKGKLTGWDDPRAPTIQSLRKRGIRGQAIVDAMIELGMSTSNVDLAMSSIYANNREIIDDIANRRFLVQDPVELPINDGPKTGTPPLHPEREELGNRTIPVQDRILIESDDLPSAGEKRWLKGYGCVKYDGTSLTVTDDSITVVRDGDVPVIHWVPADDYVDVKLWTIDGKQQGYAEPGLRNESVDAMVQFERVGFARLDIVSDEQVIAYFAHQ